MRRLTAAPSEVGTQRAFDIVSVRLIHQTSLPPPKNNSHTSISQRPHNFIPTPPGHYTAVSGSHLHHHCCWGEHRLPTTHHISGLLIQFCTGNECKASRAFGWGVLLSWWELSNVIKIHAGVLHILPVELTGRSASKQALPSLCFISR